MAVITGSVLFISGCYSNKGEVNVDKSDLMHLYKPKDSYWDSPDIPAPGKYVPAENVGVRDESLLKESAPVKIVGEKELTAFPGVTGKGTKENPYVLQNLKFVIKDARGLHIDKLAKTTHLVIRNMKFTGVPDSKYSPNKHCGIYIGNSHNITIENCEVTKCKGIYLGGCFFSQINNCKLISTIVGIMSSGGWNITADGNHVEDSVKYGVFLYNGPNMVISNNYVAWTGREGIGTNGTMCKNHYYHDNVIMHCGWTAVNLEGVCDNSKIERNFVKDTYYGIILMGKDVVTRDNKVFYSGQDGIILLGAKVRNQQIIDNLIVGSAQNGIWLMNKTSNHLVENNRIYMSHVGIKNDSVGSRIVGNEIRRFFFGIESPRSNTVISNNKIYQGRNGMSISNSTNNSIVGNQLRYLCAGIYTSKIDNTKIENNSFTYIGQPLCLRDMKDVTIKGNKLLHQAYLGIDLTNCTQVKIIDNSFDNATCRSIKVKGGSENRVSNNRISDVYAQFHGGGVLLEDTRKNRITENTFNNCTVGIRFEGSGSKGNLIENNIFKGSDKNLFLAPKRSDKQLAKDAVEKIRQENQIRMP